MSAAGGVPREVYEVELRLQHQIDAARALAEERWAGWRALDASASKLIDARLVAIAKLHEATMEATERRLAELNTQQERIERSIQDCVRADVYAKDMERSYSERQAQNAAAAQGRINAENSANANRRAIAATLATSAVALISVLASICLHFVDSIKLH